MELEKEVRYSVDDSVFEKAIELTSPYKERVEMLDITIGQYGRESVARTGKVFRVRKKPNKITLEIKNRFEGGWQEEAIELPSVAKGISFLSLAGMSPYLYIARTREVRKYKGLKIFLDDIELLGKYIEIEYQDSIDAQTEVKEFINLVNISGEPQPLYGEIMNQKYDTDEEYKAKFDARLEEIVKSMS